MDSGCIRLSDLKDHNVETMSSDEFYGQFWLFISSMGIVRKLEKAFLFQSQSESRISVEIINK